MTAWIMADGGATAFPSTAITELSVFAASQGPGNEGLTGFDVKASLTPVRPGRYLRLAHFETQDPAFAARDELLILIATGTSDGCVLEWVDGWHVWPETIGDLDPDDDLD